MKIEKEKIEKKKLVIILDDTNYTYKIQTNLNYK